MILFFLGKINCIIYYIFNLRGDILNVRKVIINEVDKCINNIILKCYKILFFRIIFYFGFLFSYRFYLK